MKYPYLKNLSISSKIGIFILLAGFTFVSCDTTSNNRGNSSNNAPVTLQFQTATSGTAPAMISAMASTSRATKAQQSGKTLTIEGNNGTLTITDVHFIVDDFELEKADGTCDNMEGNKEDDCEEFEGELFFVDLPLNNQPLELATSSIKDGTYTELEFEIDDLDVDEQEDQAEQQQIEALLADIQNEFPNWPKSASMVVSGTFESNTGKVTEFTTYAEAEVSIEMQLSPPLEINGTANKRITVSISPEKWFTRNNGTIINLAKYDYSKTGKLLEFETEMENGFHETEIEED